MAGATTPARRMRWPKNASKVCKHSDAARSRSGAPPPDRPSHGTGDALHAIVGRIHRAAARQTAGYRRGNLGAEQDLNAQPRTDPPPPHVRKVTDNRLVRQAVPYRERRPGGCLTTLPCPGAGVFSRCHWQGSRGSRRLPKQPAAPSLPTPPNLNSANNCFTHSPRWWPTPHAGRRTTARDGPAHPASPRLGTDRAGTHRVRPPVRRHDRWPRGLQFHRPAPTTSVSCWECSTASGRRRTPMTNTRNHKCLVQPHCHPELSEGPFLRPQRPLATLGVTVATHPSVIVGTRTIVLPRSVDDQAIHRCTS